MHISGFHERSNDNKTVVSLGLSNEINDMTKRNYRLDDYAINIGKKVVEFNIKDEIFNLYGPVGTKVISNSCSCCESQVKKEKGGYCDFCGSRACEKCLYKTREFKIPDNNSKLITKTNNGLNAS
jgi:rRNA maturation endonuclease Nob1